MGSSNWSMEEEEELKAVFLKKGLTFSASRYCVRGVRTAVAIATRITCMIDPTNSRLYDREFASKVKQLFPDQRPGSDLDRILRSRMIIGA